MQLHQRTFHYLALFCTFATAPACSQSSAEVRLQDADLPGFAIKAPAWKEIETVGGPAVGSHRRELGPVIEAPVFDEPGKVKRIAAGTLVVHWRGGAFTADEQAHMRELLVQSVAGSLGLDTQAQTLAPGRWVEVAVGPNGAIAIGGAYCDAGLMVNVVLGMRDAKAAQLATLASEIVRSIACKDGAGPAAPPPLNIELPGTFGVDAGSNPVMYYSLDGAVLVSNVTSGNIVRNTRNLDPVISSLLGAIEELESPRASTQPFVREDKRPAALTTIDAHIANEPTQLYLGSLYCEDVGASYVLFIAGEGMSAKVAEQLTAAMQCPGASSPVIRSVSEVFKPACHAGHANACATLIGLMEQGAAQEDRDALPELKRSACKLGLADYCAGNPVESRKE
jgi:hypothetical protein